MNFLDVTIGFFAGALSIGALMLLLITYFAKRRVNQIMKKAHIILEGIDKMPEELNYDKKMEEEEQ